MWARWFTGLHRRLLPDDPDIGWTPYLWLVYLSFFLVRYVYVPPDPLTGALLALTLVSFLALYFNGFWRRGWAVLPNIIGLAAIGAVWAPSNPGAAVFLIYSASFVGQLGPLRRAVGVLVAILAVAALLALLLQPHPIFWSTALVFSLLIGMVGIYYAGHSRRSAELRLSQQEVRQLAQVAERERISRDLHDLLGHTLSVITLKAELARQLVREDPARAEREIGDVEEVSRAALAEVREAVVGMRRRGLPGELEHARVALKAAGVEFELEGETPTLPPDAEAVLAMVLREAVTNVIRHAEAVQCRVLLRAEAGEVLLEVRDDGRGAGQREGSGIQSMRARLDDCGGRLDIDSSGGTRLRARLPLP